MTILTARFVIDRKIWKNSNQRLNPILAGAKSSKIQDYAEGVWRAEVHRQFDLEPIEPDWRPEGESEAPVDDDRTLRMDRRLSELRDRRDDWDREHASRLHVLKRTGSDEYEALAAQRGALTDSIARQRHMLSTARASIRKANQHDRRIRERADRAELVARRLEANRGRRVFSGPVRFNVMAHNISAHRFDSPNSWPTVKPIQDAATRTGIIWDDDNDSCIPITTFRSGPRLGHDYVIDVLVESMDEPLVVDPFAVHADSFANEPSAIAKSAR